MADTLPALLDAQGLSKRYGALVANDSVDIALQASEIHALIGPNGAGKSTLIGLLAGDVVPDTGAVRLGDDDITGLAAHRRAALGLARSYQVSSLFGSFTAAENIEIAIAGREKRQSPFRDARADADLRSEALGYLEELGAAGLAPRDVGALAHGQRRQVELAMVLAMRPRVVLLDEPMAGLGLSETDSLVPLLQSLKNSRAVLLVEHDMSVVFELADRITVLVGGRVIASGKPDAIRSDAAVRAAYLSEDA